MFMERSCGEVAHCAALAVASVAMPAPSFRFLPIGLLCAVVLCTTAQAADKVGDKEKAARTFLADAEARFAARDMASTVAQLRNALKADRSLAAAHVLMGRAQAGLGDAIAAEAAFEEALRNGAPRQDAVVGLARAVLAQGKPQALLDSARFLDTGLTTPARRALLLLKATASSELLDHRGALRWVEMARNLDSGGPDSWLTEVAVRLRANQWADAQTAVEKAVALSAAPHPSQADALVARANVAHAQALGVAERTAAIAAYDLALALAPTHAEALLARAGLLLDAGRQADAMRDITAVRQALPSEPRAAYLAALVAERDGKPTEAKAALINVTQLLDRVSPDFLRYRPQLLVLGGLAHMGLGAPQKARPYLEQAQRNLPSSAVSKVLAQMYFAERKVDRAIEFLDGYLKTHPTDLQGMHLLAAAHMSQGRYARAASLLQETLRRQEGPALRGLLGISQVGAGDLNQAITNMEMALRADPNQPGIGAALAMMYLQTGQSDKSVRLASSLAQASPKQPGLQHLLGLAYGRAGQAAPARKAFEAALALDSSFVAPHIALAKLDTEAAAFEAAIARLQPLMQRDPKLMDALFEMGRLNERRGQLRDAQTWYEKADDASPAQDLQAGLALVDLQLDQKQAAGAREALKRVLRKSQTALPVLIAQARVQMASSDVQAAKGTLARATSVASYEPGSLVQIALLQMQVSQLPAATYALDKALSEKPGFVAASALMVDAELRQAVSDKGVVDKPLLDKAEARARQLLVANPRLALAHALVGDVALARQQHTPALAAYRRAFQLSASSANLQRVLRAQSVGDLAGALRQAEQWLSTHPKDLAVRRLWADGQARSGNLAGARSNYLTLLQTNPADNDALSNLAHVLLLAKDGNPENISQALAYADKALANSASTPHVLGTAGWANVRAGKLDAGMQLLRLARLRDAGNPDTRYFLAAALAQQGQNAEARQELDAAMALAGGSGPGVGFIHAKDAAALRLQLK
jgi:cellulose synthase operon protein C